MDLNNHFRVGVDRDTTWKALTDLERIAPLLPGAQLQEVEGDEYRGIVKVKVGPIQAQYKGTATLLETDESAGKMVMKASGRDTRGQGNASAVITVTMTADGTGTKVTTSTALTISGKVAQFGRGVLADVSGKLIGQFVANLEKDLSDGDKPAAAPEEINDGTGQSAQATMGDMADMADMGEMDRADTNGSTTPSSPAPSSGARRIDSPEPEPVDLFDAAGHTMIRRAAPVVGVVAIVVAIVLLRRRRRTSRSARAAAKVTSTLRDVRSHVPSVSLPDHAAVVKAGRRAGKRAARQGRQAAGAGRQAAAAGRQAAEAGRQAAAEASRHAAEQVSQGARGASRRGRKAAIKAAARIQKQAVTVF